MKCKDLSTLFFERPQQYGYRGDDYFWEYMEQYFAEHTELTTRKDIDSAIRQQFEHLPGVELTATAKPHVKEFDNGGMSSGYLSGDFWLNKAIPLLLERFDNLE